MLKNFVTWLLVSSEDPQTVSLTVKGFLIGAIPAIMAIAGFGHFTQITSSLVNADINYIVLFIQSSLTVIGASVSAWGFIRKIINTWLIPDPVIPPGTATINTGN